MLISDYIQKVIKLKDAILDKVEFYEDHAIYHVHMPQRIHKCPRCGEETSKIHDYRTQTIKHLPGYNCHTVVVLRKRRHVCPCCNKRFIESIPFLAKYQRTTNHLWASVYEKLKKVVPLSHIAKELNISQGTVSRITDKLSFSIVNLPKVIAIDEFRGNAGGEKFQCLLTSPPKEAILDVLPTRKSEDLYMYFSRFKNRENVKYVIMDMSPLFRSVVKNCFPNAQIVADKFHVARLVTWAFESVRKRVQKEFNTSRRKYFKRSRQLLLKNPNKLSSDQAIQVSNMLSISNELANAYLLKNKFYEFMGSKDRQEATKLLKDWYLYAGVINIPDFNKCLETFNNWQNEILNAFETGYTNGFTEGCNNKIKVLKRVSYGVRDFNRFKKRIMSSICV